MTDRPIIFSGPMVQALFDETKTQTRRLATSPLRLCKPGDRLYVREAWAKTSVAPIVETIDNPWTVYRVADNRCDYGGPWKPSIHMKRVDSRITLVITDVKTEPLQNITEEDAKAEGAACVAERIGGKQRHVVGFGRIWEALHQKPGQRWGDNPEVVALTFTVQKHNIDRHHD